MNRCKHTGMERQKPFLTIEDSNELRRKIDRYIDHKIEEWNATVPFATHFEKGEIHTAYYQRFLIETALRIRLLRVSESRTLAEVAKISPDAAQIWAHYEYEEMIHDRLFIEDAKKTGASIETILSTEPYLSTKLLTGFFSYLLDHEGPLGVLVYSYLVEYVNVKLDPKKISGLKSRLGEKAVSGQISHMHTDLNDDHPGEVWNAIRHLIRSEADVRSLTKYIDEHQSILAMFFREIHEDQVLSKVEGTV